MTHDVTATRAQAPARYPVYLSLFRKVRSEDELRSIIDEVSQVVFRPGEEGEREQIVRAVQEAIQAEQINSFEKLLSSQFFTTQMGAPGVARLRDRIIADLVGVRGEKLLTGLYPARDYTEEQCFEVFDQVTRELEAEKAQEEWDEMMKGTSYAELPLTYCFYGLTVLADAPHDIKEYVSRKWKKNAPIIANKVHALAQRIMEMKKYPQAVAGSVVRGINGIGKHPIVAVATAVTCIAVPIIASFFFNQRSPNSSCCNFHSRDCSDVLKNVQTMEEKL